MEKTGLEGHVHQELEERIAEVVEDLVSLPTSCPRHGLEWSGREIETLHIQLCEHAVRITAIKLRLTGYGLGRAIVEQIIDFCREHKLIPVAVDTEDDLMTGASEFWEAIGFVPAPNDPHCHIHRGWIEHYERLFC